MHVFGKSTLECLSSNSTYSKGIPVLPAVPIVSSSTFSLGLNNLNKREEDERGKEINPGTV